MLDPRVQAIADAWWAGDFDCAPAQLRTETTHVQSHAGRMHDAAGIWILCLDDAISVSLPPDASSALREHARTWTRALVEDPAALAEAIRPRTSPRIIGPAFIGYGTADTLDLRDAAGARRLTAEDHPAVDALRTACEEEAWEHGGSDPRAVPTFGCFDDAGGLLALAGFKTWGEHIAHLSIVTAPEARGRGLGAGAVAAAAREALKQGLLAQYRTLADNAPSMGIARRLGFEPYGFSVFVRLPRD